MKQQLAIFAEVFPVSNPSVLTLNGLEQNSNGFEPNLNGFDQNLNGFEQNLNS